MPSPTISENLSKFLDKFGGVARQTAIFSFICMLTLSKNLFDKIGESGYCFYLGSTRFWNFDNPYFAPNNVEHFKYSPVFAFLYYPITLLSVRGQAFVWGMMNVIVFWLGISLWFRLRDLKANRHVKWFLFYFVICSMELDGPVRHFQMNPLLIGLILTALYFYRSGRTCLAGVLLFPVATVKAFLLFLPLMLVFHRNRRYVAGLLLGALLTFTLPILRVGFLQNIFLHEEWFLMLLDNSRVIGGVPLDYIISLSNAFLHLGWPMLGKALSVLVLAGSTGALIAMGLRQPTLDWNRWIPMCLSCIVLVNPGTEGPTFVILIPACLFLLSGIAAKGGPYERSKLIGLFLSAMLITLVHNDIWPKFLVNLSGPHAVSKTLGALLLWFLSFV